MFAPGFTVVSILSLLTVINCSIIENVELGTYGAFGIGSTPATGYESSGYSGSMRGGSLFPSK